MPSANLYSREPWSSLAPARRLVPVSPPYTRSLARARVVAAALRDLPAAPDIVQACECGGEGLWYSLRGHPDTTFITRLATPSVLVAELSQNAGGQRMRTAYMDWMERTQTRCSDAIISPSAALAEAVTRRWRMPAGCITLIPTGVDFADRYSRTAGELPAELVGRDFLLYFGRLEERKGVHVLAEALPEVMETYPSLHFVFAGENYLTYRGRPMQAYVEQCGARYRDRLHFLRRLPQNQLYPLLQSALFVVLPSLWESLANAALEALDMGKPVVATRGCGFGEVVEDGRSGFLVPPGDAAALRDAMLTLMRDHARLREMSVAATRTAERFRLPRLAARLLSFYQSLRREPLALGAGQRSR